MSLDDDMALLARQPLLSLMERDALRLLAFAAESRTLRAGDVLFRAGEASDGAVLVVSGALALATADDGRPANEIVGPGALVGELALFTSVPRQATAIAREPTQVMRLPRSVMRRVLGESPASAEAIAAAIGDRLRGFVGELSTVQKALSALDEG
ncbi:MULTISPECIES: cyclic nucleotide-binding domain-containing protein [unclassified Bosea (in: a-proteobacteria)]|uniref:cyclic nucleotide-binding domain-containing protein n=1 Tax=unclassified Bosea (in: a-proteobacteria) TaxID=2653178 RepID=UPI000953EC4D|nr:MULTISPECIES: cyclic nucleotide-binding domain-containing protein [unclassified Bosea (in: a-proteobacteria)]TAJ34378.1 MAG: cyclic nucleotide-binding domain-containing protein [Bosea sp. (in: a-proteobacteria)]SIR52175.1 Cyclic nucleotide-binding domain-containing protein [Bosea sp. TND4EK4]